MSSKKIKHNNLIKNKYIIKDNNYNKKDNNIKIICIICLIITIFFSILSYFLLIPKIVIDDELIEINYNDKYIDEDYKAFNFFKDYTDKVKIKGQVNNTKVGIYKLKYTLKYGFITVEKDKKVMVSDNINPIITLTGKDKVTICPNMNYIEEGFQVIDEYDGDITDKIKIEKTGNIIKYSACDSSFNCSNIKREIVYDDKEKPKIELLGDEEVIIYKGSNYKEIGYKAFDNCDGDITNKVTINNNVDTNKVGTYEIKYTVSDNYSNVSETIRKVKVIERKYNYNNNDKGVIYLTFDDGPSNLTLDILNILKEENIKATFFVTGAIDNYNYILKKEFDEGHTIALHTYSHNYEYLYSDKNNFWQDIDKLNNSVERITGKRSMIIRFPGGSSNTVSKRYKKGIMTELASEVLNKGYNYFDWNVDSNDAGGDIRNSNKIYENVINNLNYNRNNIVLFHDANGHNATVNALRNIIIYAKNNGYTFNKLDINTSPVRHGINN